MVVHKGRHASKVTLLQNRALDYRIHVSKAPHIQNIAPDMGGMQERLHILNYNIVLHKGRHASKVPLLQNRALDYRRHVSKAPHIQNIAPDMGDMQERLHAFVIKPKIKGDTNASWQSILDSLHTATAIAILCW